VNNYISVQLHQCTTTSVYNYISVQLHQCTTTSVYNYISVQQQGPFKDISTICSSKVLWSHLF